MAAPHHRNSFGISLRPLTLTPVCARRYAREAEIESEIVLSLQRTLPPGERFPIVRLYRTFESRGHFCLSFEKIGPSLYHVLKLRRAHADGNSMSLAAAAAAAGGSLAKSSCTATAASSTGTAAGAATSPRSLSISAA